MGVRWSRCARGPRRWSCTAADGVTVGEWGREEALGPDVVAVRQNLALVVDGGVVRPGLGIDASGQLLYLAGDQLTLAGLAQAMAEAGVVGGLQLDIHPDMVAFATYHPDRPGTAPSTLLTGMRSTPTRYLAPDQRDFFAVTLADTRRS